MSFLTRSLFGSFHNIRFIQSVAKYPPRKVEPLSYLIDSDINLVKLLRSKKPLTEQDWKQARDELHKYSFVNEKNVDAAIETICANLNPMAFLSYVQYLRRKNYEVNLYIAGKYVSLFQLKKSELTDFEKEEIYAIYDYMRKKYPILDVDTCERFIEGLCLTDRWKESIDLLDMIKISSEIGPGPLSVIIRCAFLRGKPDIGWKYMNLAYEENITIIAKVYYSYLQYCLSTFKDKKELEINIVKMFEFLKVTGIIISEQILNEYSNALQDLEYTHTKTTITRLGRCRNCSHQLLASVITLKEFDEMSKFFMDEVFVAGNVYYNTTPKEYKQFMTFLKDVKPYDIVIDGLNIALCNSRLEDSSAKKAFRLSKAVEHFVTKNKKIILLGRRHMLKWKHMDYIRHNSKMFLVDNSSSDDVYLLFATLYGGMRTCFLSMDLMRKQKSQLPINIQGLFKKWQLSHQYMIDIRTGNMKTPATFELTSQNDESGWHIPYHSGKKDVGKDSYETTTNWICLKKNK